MAERTKIGILFSYSEGWIGGAYYFINLVNSFLHLPDEQRPQVILLSDSEESYKKMQETGYPYITYLHSRFSYNGPERLLNKIARALTKKNLIQKGYNKKELPVLFGYYEQLRFHKCNRKAYWIPDLQDCHYPQYLGEAVAEERRKQHIQLAYSNAEVVFSSEDSRRDFDSFYPGSTCKKYVVPFAVTLPDIGSLTVNDTLKKFALTKPYYFSPNQFWSHKNHLVVIKAIASLKERGIDRKVVFTGNENTGGGSYARDLKAYVKDNALEDNCIFLGFIDRKEQLLLMRESVAVIQPSLFEGWSTVIEDAKALNKFVFASDLGVHKEQLKRNMCFFDPNNEEDLASILISHSEPVAEQLDYSSNIKTYANTFINIF